MAKQDKKKPIKFKTVMENTTLDEFKEEEEILLCVCVNCGEIHGLQPPTTLMDIDKKILCCQRPDNTKVLSNAMKPLSYFVKHWKDL